MPIVDSKEVGVVSQILQHAAGVLTLLLFWTGTHQTGDIHLYALQREHLVLDPIRSLVLFLLLFGLAGSKYAEEVHRI
jgi:hypothetical protein